MEDDEDSASDSPNEALFWRLAASHLERDEVQRSTMMGSPCLRSSGQFYAMVHRHTKQLIVKLPAARVEELIAAGTGEAFQPAGRVFREWLASSTADEATWSALLEEARGFVTD